MALGPHWSAFLFGKIRFGGIIMLYYLYLKKKSQNESKYYTLTSINYDNEVRPGMTITFDPLELYEFTLEYPELRGMGSSYRVINVNKCDGMGGITLE